MGGSTEIIDAPDADLDSSLIPYPSSLAICLVSGGMDSAGCLRSVDFASASIVTYGSVGSIRPAGSDAVSCRRVTLFFAPCRLALVHGARLIAGNELVGIRPSDGRLLLSEVFVDPKVVDPKLVGPRLGAAYRSQIFHNIRLANAWR